MRLWAPAAERAELVLESGERRPMEKVDRHHHVVDDPQPGSDYRISLDGGEDLPDPRSAWQPEGVNGASRAYDHGGFVWTDAAWTGLSWPARAIYEMHVGTFSPEGTFDGAAERLDHLVALGVDTVELMPVAQFPGRRGWGYDGVHLWAAQDSYGGPDGLKRFVDRAHALGLAVMLDVVYNHLGPLGNHLPEFGPYFTDIYITPWGEAVNLDGPGSDGVRAHICESARMWIRDFHIDGLRLDAVHAFIDRSARHLLEELADAVQEEARQVGRSVAVVAESEANDPRLVTGAEQGGYGLDGVWADDFHHCLHTLLTGERDGYYADFGQLSDLADAWTRNWVYDGRYSPARDRHHGRSAASFDPGKFVVCLQNHDQIGNRAKGERIGHLAGTEAQRLGAAIALLAPQVPLVFQGEEWAASAPFPYFTDHPDPELAEAVRQGRRQEFAAFGWDPAEIPDPQAESTFRSAVLDWQERDRSPHAEMETWYRDLLALRKDIADKPGDRHAEQLSDNKLRLIRPGVELEVDFEKLTVDIRPQ
jgi:maltooligosyltrehalose trehalohydrolase